MPHLLRKSNCFESEASWRRVALFDLRAHVLDHLAVESLVVRVMQQPLLQVLAPTVALQRLERRVVEDAL